MSKVYEVHEKPFTEVTCFVRAESQSEAKRKAISADESECMQEAEWISLRAKRASEFDGVLSESALVSAGRMYVECTCGATIRKPRPEYDGDQVEPLVMFVSPNGGVYCSESCWRNRPHYRERVEIDSICLYAE